MFLDDKEDPAPAPVITPPEQTAVKTIVPVAEPPTSTLDGSDTIAINDAKFLSSLETDCKVIKEKISSSKDRVADVWTNRYLALSC